MDRAGRDLCMEGHDEINKETKAGLLALLLEPVALRGANGPLLVHLERMLASLVRCYMGESAKLEIPTLI